MRKKIINLWCCIKDWCYRIRGLNITPISSNPIGSWDLVDELNIYQIACLWEGLWPDYGHIQLGGLARGRRNQLLFACGKGWLIPTWQTERLKSRSDFCYTTYLKFTRVDLILYMNFIKEKPKFLFQVRGCSGDD